VLSKNGKKAIKILEKLKREIEDFQDVYNKLDNNEKNLIGGLVVGVYSPAGDIGFTAVSGSTVFCNGLAELLKAKSQENPLARLFD